MPDNCRICKKEEAGRKGQAAHLAAQANCTHHYHPKSYGGGGMSDFYYQDTCIYCGKRRLISKGHLSVLIFAIIGGVLGLGVMFLVFGMIALKG